MFLRDLLGCINDLVVTSKNLRICTILVAIYKMVLAHVALFIMLLGLAHAEKVKVILGGDIKDQKELDDYYPIAMNGNGESINQIRFKSASELTAVTLKFLYIGTAIASMYLLCCLGLFIGIFKNKYQLMVPWLVFDPSQFLLYMGLAFTLFIKDDMSSTRIKLCIFLICFMLYDFFLWSFVFIFYRNLKQMSKLTEIATVAIPCPPPGSIPYHYRKENMYLGSGGYKHILTDADPSLG